MAKSKRNKKRIILIAVIGALMLLTFVVAAYFANSFLERNTYLLSYRDDVVKYSKKYELDPYLVAAVIHCESGNRSDSVSPKGAVGLMQIMPDTGEWIAGKLGIEGYEPSMLMDASLNIEMGCWYLNYLYKRFLGNVTNITAAYNAGHGNVSKWLNDANYAKDGQLVNIPYAETREYVEKVRRAAEKYKELYEDELTY